MDTATVKKTGEEHVMLQNYGWQLFNCIPLVCGNAEPDASCKTAFFRDDVTMDKIQARMVAYAAGRQIGCPVYTNYDTVFINVFGVPIPYVITYKEITLSANLK